MKHIRRELERQVRKAAKGFPAIVSTGPRRHIGQSRPTLQTISHARAVARTWQHQWRGGAGAPARMPAQTARTPPDRRASTGPQQRAAHARHGRSWDDRAWRRNPYERRKGRRRASPSLRGAAERRARSARRPRHRRFSNTMHCRSLRFFPSIALPR
jgi:hypothetical protein